MKYAFFSAISLALGVVLSPHIMPALRDCPKPQPVKPAAADIQRAQVQYKAIVCQSGDGRPEKHCRLYAGRA